MPKKRGAHDDSADAETHKLCLAFERLKADDTTPTRWEDRDGLPLENQITDIIVGLASAAEQRRRIEVERQRAWEARQRAEAEERGRQHKLEAERRERERLLAAEKAKIDSLLQDAEAWRAADNLRAFIAAAIEAVKGHVDGEQLVGWTRWAMEQADHLDPISSGRAIKSVRSHPKIAE